MFPKSCMGGVIAVVAVAVCSGCVLTSGQVDAVKKFSAATDQYGTMPGAAIDAYADGYVANRFVLNVQGQRLVTKADGTGPVENLPSILKLRRDFEVEAERANRALDVLDRYSQLLSTLTSDQFEASLIEEATGLADNLDAAIEKYNAVAGTSVPSIGSKVAELVRGAFGIWIRVKQEQAIKVLVPSADKPIEALTADIATLMERFTSTTSGYIAGEESNLRASFTNAVNIQNQDNRGSLPLDFVQLYAKQMEQLDAIRDLALSAKTSAERYRTAHSALVQAINQPQSVNSVLEQIKVLRGEIDEARKLKKTIDEKRTK